MKFEHTIAGQDDGQDRIEWRAIKKDGDAHFQGRKPGGSWEDVVIAYNDGDVVVYSGMCLALGLNPPQTN